MCTLLNQLKNSSFHIRREWLEGFDWNGNHNFHRDLNPIDGVLREVVFILIILGRRGSRTCGSRWAPLHPQQFFNGFSVVHGFTSLKIVVVRVVRSLVLISQPLIEPKRFIMKYMLFHSIFPNIRPNNACCND